MTVSNLEIITLANLHTHRTTTGKTVDDTRLGTAVDMVNRALFDLTRQKWFKVTSPEWELILDGPRDGATLRLPHTPVDGTMTTVQRGYYAAGGVWTANHTYTAGVDYVLDAELGVLTALPPQPFSAGPLSMRVVYASGWSVLPADITWAALAWASVEYERAAGLRHDQLSQAFVAGSNSYTLDTIPLASRRIIDRYTRRDQLV